MKENSQSTNSSDTSVAPTFIVGIGASAGGLNALEQFFDNMSPDSGMAFVVIQHLSPDFKSLMDDLLSRHTTMPIHRVTSGIALEANNIYLIPPKNQMTVREERLYLTEKIASQHIELPIDVFFHSLAEDAGERSIGIILSGTGSDGSRGVLSIHRKGGLVMIQSPESAQFDGMPRNAVATGVSDFILSPDRMPRILIEYTVSPQAVRSRQHHELEIFEDEGEFAEVFALLRRSYNLDFSKYKGSTVGRRIRRRMEFRQIPEVSDYASIISGDKEELESLYKDLLIGVTEFFRDSQSFRYLEQEVVPQLFANLHRGEDLRAWSAACATGEEAYSLAILLAEHAEYIDFKGKITVFATDVHKTSLDTASQGLYEKERLANVSQERLERYFKQEGGNLYRVTSELRKLVVFAPHNLLSDPPFTRLDLICCRNLLIYFQPVVQEKVISLFHFALKKDCTLFLGSSEGLGVFANEFEVMANQHKMFRKIRDLKLAIDLDPSLSDRSRMATVTSTASPHSRIVSLDRQVLADYDALLRRHLPPGVLVNENRQILHYFGDVADYLKTPEGRVENDLLKLAEDNLHIAISTALQRSEKTRQPIVTRNVRIHRGTEELLIDLHLDPLPDEKTRSTHYHIYFERVRPVEQILDAADECSDQDNRDRFDSVTHYRLHIADLETELQSARESLQTTIEELQTSNEELQATNEELLAANEELQSTNEELHSVNEELYSVNSEFERKNIELKQLNSDHDNLLASSDIGTVFLDRQLRIRKFNPAIAAFFKLLPQDLGRPIDHIAYHLSDQEEMLADIQRVIKEGVLVEREKQTRDGTWLLNRITPFRIETGQLEGVLITFTDISSIKEAEHKILKANEWLEQKVDERTAELRSEIQERIAAESRLQEARDYYLNILKSAPALIWRADTTGMCDWFNDSWLEFTGRSMEDEYGNGWAQGVHVDDLDHCIGIWQSAFARHEPFEMEYRLLRHDGIYRWILDIGRPFFHIGGEFAGYIGYCFDITERRQLELDLIAAREAAESASRAKSDFLAAMSHEIRTPMNGVLGMSSILRESELNPEQQECVRTISDSAELLLNIINDILDLSQIEAGRMSIKPINFELDGAINDVLRLLSPQAAEKGLELSCDYPDDLPRCFCADAGRIRQVLINMAGNAIKFTSKGSVKLTVACLKQDVRETVMKISISDTGVGIPEDKLPLLFQKFSQLSPVRERSTEGTGLGLAISKQLVEMMGGTCSVVSTVGVGSVFSVTLPLNRCDTTDNQPAAESKASGDVQVATAGSSRVLLVDDSQINLKVLRMMLQRVGIKPDLAQNGRQAIDMHRANSYDIILMDCFMPELDGFGATAEIRRMEEGSGKRTVIIALTANAAPNDRELCLAAGMDDYLAKPIQFREVETMIAHWSSRIAGPESV